MKNCENCKYSEPIGGGLACMGQKGMPFIKPTDLCERWKTKKQTNYDRIRAMTDEELADFLWSIGANPATGNYYLNGKLLFSYADGNGWLDWLKQEAT